MRNIKKVRRELDVPRHVAIIATRLGIKFQPNSGSSMYKLPPKEKIIPGQEDWNCPFGTLRLSDHWGILKCSCYEEQNSGECNCPIVFQTDVPVPTGSWVLAVNNDGWKVVHIFQLKKSNIIYSLDFNKIKFEVEKACYMNEAMVIKPNQHGQLSILLRDLI
ncbi:MAG: hypothetical protein V4439_02255 [Patescibacteria group bacterium]